MNLATKFIVHLTNELAGRLPSFRIEYENKGSYENVAIVANVNGKKYGNETELNENFFTSDQILKYEAERIARSLLAIYDQSKQDAES